MTQIEISTWLVKDKKTILETWQNDKKLTSVLEKYAIDTQFFVHHFGSRILNYFTQVIEAKKSVGQCPSVMALLLFFEKKNIKLDDVYITCSAFKNTVLKLHVQTHGLNDSKTFDLLSETFDKNFSGVIHEYIVQNYHEHESENTIGCFVNIDKIENSESCPLDTLYEEEELHEFNELEDEIIFAIEKINSKSFDHTIVKNLSKKLIKYGSQILTNPIYKEMGDSLIILGMAIEGENDTKDIIEKMNSVGTMIDCFMNDLIIWRKNLLQKNPTGIHFYDKSIISNVEQICILLRNEDNENECKEIEFF